MTKQTKTRVSITMTRPYVEALDGLIEAGIYLKRGDIVLEALRCFFKDLDIELPKEPPK